MCDLCKIPFSIGGGGAADPMVPEGPGMRLFNGIGDFTQVGGGEKYAEEQGVQTASPSKQISESLKTTYCLL